MGLCFLAKNLWSRTETHTRGNGGETPSVRGLSAVGVAEAGDSRVLLWLFALRAVKVKSSAPPPCFTVRAA